jgi:hypothetical protein
MTQTAMRAFTVIKRAEGQNNFWLPISATFPHQSGDGYNVILQALPSTNEQACASAFRRPDS